MNAWSERLFLPERAAFFSSLGFSAALSGAGCGGCWAKLGSSPRSSKVAALKHRSRNFIGGGTPSQTFAKSKSVAWGIVCESPGSVKSPGTLPRRLAGSSIAFESCDFADGMCPRRRSVFSCHRTSLHLNCGHREKSCSNQDERPTIQLRVIFSTEMVPAWRMMVRNSRRRISSTASTPGRPKAASPQA